MRSKLRRQRGSLLIGVIAILMTAALAVLVNQVGELVSKYGRDFSNTQMTLIRIQNALVRYVSLNGVMPCPANPADTVTPGVANGGTPLVNGDACAYPGGVVPWQTIGLQQSEVVDEWGNLVSYRVYGEQHGLTVQPNGMSAAVCDTTNALAGGLGQDAAAETPPDSFGRCVDNNTLEASFFSYPASSPTYTKGLSVADFGRVITDAAYVLVSHGPSGKGAYLPGGSRREMPNASATDYPNTQASPTQFVVASSDKSIQPDEAGHYDDVVNYLRIGEMLRLALKNARDWPDSMFNASTTENMTSPSSDPNNPHFISSGSDITGQSITRTDSSGATLQVGNGVGSYSACLWWPNLLTLVDNSIRRKMVTYVEFASVDNPSDAFPGFNLGFLSGSEGAPTNSTCGTGTAATTTATGPLPSSQRDIRVASTNDIVVGFRAFGNGIPFNATVSSVNTVTNVVRLSANLTSAITGGAVSFADGNMVRRDLGWAGGTLASRTKRFAVEFDAFSESPNSASAGNDPSRPHIALNYTATTHGTNSASCATSGAGLPCDTPASSIAVRTTAVTGTSGSVVTTVSNAAGISPGMTAVANGVQSGATVATVVGTTVSLSSTLTQNLTTPGRNVSFGALSTFPAVSTTASGTSGQSFITVADVSRITNGMSVSRDDGTPMTSGTPRVTSISGKQVNLSNGLVGDFTSAPVTFSGLATSNLMQNGTSVFHSARVEVSPRDCVQVASTAGNANEKTITVSDANLVQVGSSAQGIGIGVGATVESIAGNTLTLTKKNTLAVSGTITFGGHSAVKTKVTSGASGSTSITVVSPTNIKVGHAVSGIGIGSGAKVTAISGSDVTLSVANSSALSLTEDYVFTPALALVESWTLTNAGCAQDPTTCGALKTMTSAFTLNDKFNLQAAATGSNGDTKITLTSLSSGVIPGMRVFGTGIGAGTYVTATSLSGGLYEITLSSANTAAISGATGDIVFRNPEALHIVSCVPEPTNVSNYDTLYLGLTTANRTANSAKTTTGSGSSGATTISVTDAAGIAIGMSVRGTGIADFATVTGVAGTTITLSAANTANVSGTVSFAGGANAYFRNLYVNGLSLP